MSLPDGEWEFLCGSCGDVCTFEDSTPICYSCGLDYDPDTQEATYSDEYAAPCGEPCTNSWHAPGRIRAGIAFECGACILPTGHVERLHYHDCRQIKIGGGA